MIRSSVARPALSLFTLLLTLLVAACGAGGEKAQSNTAAAGNSSPSTPQPTSSAAAGNTTTKAKLNLNTASANEFLSGVPGIGNRMVHEFEEYRPYRSIQQFRREMGKYVKPEQIAEYEKYVYVPIAENDSDAATLQQIPGLDATEAEALIANRPYASRDAFLAKLSEKISAEQLATARNYLSDK